jgi:HAD superfamily hydrolase (TIGR01484 family)
MTPLAQAAASTFEAVRFVLTDMDETLTYQGRLAAATYDALERLQRAGIRVIPVTAAPAGWCDQMARMWPVDGVIGENGGLFFQRAAHGHGLLQKFWHAPEDQPAITARLTAIGKRVQEAVPEAVFAEDQAFRLTCVAFAQPQDPVIRSVIISALRNSGADVTVNNLWLLGWLGGYDKLAMSRRVMAEVYGLDIDENPDTVLYVGDSTNDAPMFGFFRHSVGVSTVTRYLSEIPVPPRWITAGPGGAGFVEAADAVIRAQKA